VCVCACMCACVCACVYVCVCVLRGAICRVHSMMLILHTQLQCMCCACPISRRPSGCVRGVCALPGLHLCSHESQISIAGRACMARTPEPSTLAPPIRPRLCFRLPGTHTHKASIVCHLSCVCVCINVIVNLQRAQHGAPMFSSLRSTSVAFV
jgi:hypothetical protein